MALTKKQHLQLLLQNAIDAFQRGEIKSAIGLLAKNSASFPKAPRLWAYLGFLYTESDQQAKARACFSRVVKLSPHSEQGSLGLFHSLWRLGKTDAAFDEMRRFLKSNDSPRYRALLRDMLSESPEGAARELLTA